MTQEKNFFIKRGTVAVVALAVMILWGSAFPFVQVCTEGFQVAANDIPSRLFLAGIRFFSAALIMTVLCLLQGKNMRIPCRCIMLCLHELSGIMALSQRRGCHHGEITASA